MQENRSRNSLLHLSLGFYSLKKRHRTLFVSRESGNVFPTFAAFLFSGNDAWGIGIVSFRVVEYGGGDLSLSKPKTVDLIA